MCVRGRITVLLVLVVGVVAAEAGAASYSFTKIGDADVNEVANQAVVLSSSGAVAFSRTGGSGVQTLYTGRGAGLTKIADTAGSFSRINAWDVNRFGVVGFSVEFDAGGSISGQAATGVFTGSGGALKTVLLSNGNYSRVGGGAINDRGQVALVVTLSTGETAIATRWPDRVIATSAGDELALGDINNRGVVSFQTITGNEQLFVGSGGPVTTLVDAAETPIMFFLSAPLINDAGTVAFRARTDNDLVGIFTADDEGGLRKVVDNGSGPAAGFGLGAPAINNFGQLAAEIQRNDYKAIYTGVQSPARVIEVGDALDGSRVTWLSTGDTGRFMNDAGQLAFWAALADGRAGIYRADPVGLAAIAIPEPAGVFMIVLAAAGVVVGRYAGRTPRKTSG